MREPVYGLNDAPLAWQLCLHEFAREQGGLSSSLDENIVWKNENGLTAMATTHVDDLAVTADQKWLNKYYDLFVQRFKKVSRNAMPFEHCGCEYNTTPSGIVITQKEFSKKIPLAAVPKRAPESRLLPEKITQLRSSLGALLWLTATRLDLVADVSILPSSVTTAQVRHLQQVNKVIKQAQGLNNVNLGLHYRKFNTMHQRIIAVHDSSHASKGKCHAQEGILIMMIDDPGMEKKYLHIENAMIRKQPDMEEYATFYTHMGKAKRISYSTSRSETLAAVSAMEVATLVRLRLSEINFPKVMPTVKELIAIHGKGDINMSIDMCTDCKDYYELTTGSMLPQDRTQRLYILSIRESRIAGRIRQICLIPTESMTADGLTKPMLSTCLVRLISSGVVEFKNADHNMEVRHLPTSNDCVEEDLYEGDRTITEKIAYGTLALLTARKAPITLAALVMLPQAASTTTTTLPEIASADEGVSDSFFIYGIILVSMATALLMERLITMIHKWYRDYESRKHLHGMRRKLANMSKKYQDEVAARMRIEDFTPSRAGPEPHGCCT